MSDILEACLGEADAEVVGVLEEMLRLAKVGEIKALLAVTVHRSGALFGTICDGERTEPKTEHTRLVLFGTVDRMRHEHFAGSDVTDGVWEQRNEDD